MNKFYRENTGIIFSPEHPNLKYDWFIPKKISLDEEDNTVTAELHLWSSEADAIDLSPKRLSRSVIFDKGEMETVAEAWAHVFTLENFETFNGELISLSEATLISQ